MSKGEDKEGRLWVPGNDDGVTVGDTIDEVVQAYLVLLEVCYPEHHKSFQRRLKNDPDAARAEAVVFCWLRQKTFRPSLSESPGVGGIDFLCVPDFCGPFLVEVTILKKDAVTLRSGWPDELTEAARSFGMVTPNLWSKTRAKAPQLGAAASDVPRVLVICLAHIGASALVGPLAAQWLMTSEPRIAVPIVARGDAGPARQVTDLRNAAFFRVENGKVIPVRQSISAILLASIWDGQLDVVGLLHPLPTVPFDYRVLGAIPFLRVALPMHANGINTEWVIGNPDARKFYHRKLVITDAELKGDCSGRA